MLRVYYASLIAEGAEVSPERLSEYRRERLRSTAGALSRRQSVTAELLLNMAAEEYGLAAPLNIVRAEHGKPEIRGGGLCFSLSHSGQLALCAVSDRPIGADIQRRRRDKSALTGRFFAPDERELVSAAADKDREFTRLWTMKESCIKAVGTGLAAGLSSFSVASGRISGLPGAERLQLWHWEIGEYHIGVCCSPEHGAPPHVEDRSMDLRE